MPTTALRPARSFDASVIALLVMLCASWGLQQAGIKIAMAEIPPMTQMAIRSSGGALLMLAYAFARGVPVFRADGTILYGLGIGLLFGAEFVLIYLGLSWTAASRSVVFLYTAPFFVALGAVWLLPGERLRRGQWLGLALSFIGVVVALGVPVPGASGASLVGDLFCLAGGALWGATTLMIRATRLRYAPPEKVILYQLVVSAAMAWVTAALLGEEIAGPVSFEAISWMTYQTVWIAFVTFVFWFRLVSRHPAGPLQAATAMTPLFGVAFGVVLIGEPLTWSLALAAVLVVVGLMFVNARVKRA
ncbi:DMT family transporter [Pseudoxanthobacter sp. M-2]|uniref:DMT family transporter n=1 Tax=Pseudoxanthobacter sp. M-2 TaxID=3078754 RepID=UPI0038FD3D73